MALQLLVIINDQMKRKQAKQPLTNRKHAKSTHVESKKVPRIRQIKSKDNSFLEEQHPLLSPIRKHSRSATPKPRLSRSKTPQSAVSRIPIDRERQSVQIQLKRQRSKEKSSTLRETKRDSKSKKENKAPKANKMTKTFSRKANTPMPSGKKVKKSARPTYINFQSIINTCLEETGRLITKARLTEEFQFRDSELLLMEEMLTTELILEKWAFAAVVIQRWWRRLRSSRSPVKQISQVGKGMSHSPCRTYFGQSRKYQNLSNFSSIRKSFDISKENSNNVILQEVLRLAESCQINGNFCLTKFKDDLIRAFQLNSQSPSVSKKQVSAQSKVEMETSRVEFWASSRLSRLKSDKSQTFTPKKNCLQFEISLKRNDASSKQLAQLSKQLGQQQVEDRHQVGPGCLFTFEDEGILSFSQGLQSQQINDDLDLLFKGENKVDQNQVLAGQIEKCLIEEAKLEITALLDLRSVNQRTDEVDEYIKKLISFSAAYFSQLQNNLSKVIGVSPANYLRHVQSEIQFAQFQEDGEYATETVYRNALFLELDKMLVDTRDSKSANFLRQCLNKVAFDAFNDALDWQRPYGNARSYPPWPEISIHAGRAIKGPKRSLYAKLQRGRERVARWAQDPRDQCEEDWLRYTDDSLIVRLMLGSEVEDLILKELLVELITSHYKK